MTHIDRLAFATALDRLRVPQLVMSLRRAASPWITVLTYHRVLGRDGAAGLDDGVVDATPAQLDLQLAFIRRWLSPVSLDDLLAHVQHGRALPSNPVLVTFDDGYRDNQEIALPILLKHDVRATFFVATDYVERRRPFWWDRVAWLIKRTTREHLSLDYPERLDAPVATPAQRSRAAGRVLRVIKDRPGLDLERMLDGLERAAGVTASSDELRRLAEETVMSWDQVRSLRRAGMDVQSHTHTHRVLQTLDAPTLARELRVSRSLLEDAVGAPVRAISYPVGRPLGGAPDLRLAVRDAGYELGFSNGTGVNGSRRLDPLDVRRVAMEVELGDGFFRATIAIPWLAYGRC
jgi:peptidoglycan/xylan/chitin deacetylase (PgdA/CDA1 family)